MIQGSALAAAEGATLSAGEAAAQTGRVGALLQEGMGLIGMFVIHPRSPSPDQRVVRDFTIMLTVQAPLAEPVAPRGPAAEGASTVNAASANGFLGSMPITETRR